MQTAPNDHTAPAAATAGELVAQTLSEARELVLLEVQLAKAELKEEIARTKRAAIAGAIGAMFITLALTALVVALVLALGGTAATALIVAAILAGLGAAGGAIAYAAAPKDVLGQTREHVKQDVEQLKEHVA